MNDVVAELLARETDIEVVQSPGTGDAASPDPDILIVPAPDPEDDPDAVSLLYRFPRSRVLSLSWDARRSCLYELRPHRRALGELNRATLLGAVRRGGEGG